MKKPIELKLDDRKELIIKVTITFEFLTVWLFDIFVCHILCVTVFSVCVHQTGRDVVLHG